jgi:hypothetical protein
MRDAINAGFANSNHFHFKIWKADDLKMWDGVEEIRATPEIGRMASGASRRQGEQNISIPSAVQSQRLIELQVATAHVNAR